MMAVRPLWASSALSRGRGRQKKRENNLMHLSMHLAPRCHAQSKRRRAQCRAPAVKGSRVCRMHGAAGGAPKGNKNALKHGAKSRDFLGLEADVKAYLRAMRAAMELIK